MELLSHEYPWFLPCASGRPPRSEDREVWAHAVAHDLVIVSRDTDFRERSYVEGFPPKVIWLDVGNAGTAEIVRLLKRERQRLEEFDRMEGTSLLILSIGPTAI